MIELENYSFAIIILIIGSSKNHLSTSLKAIFCVTDYFLISLHVNYEGGNYTFIVRNLEDTTVIP